MGNQNSNQKEEINNIEYVLEVKIELFPVTDETNKSKS